MEPKVLMERRDPLALALRVLRGRRALAGLGGLMVRRERRVLVRKGLRVAKERVVAKVQ